jgi:hypothetical protein
MTTAACEYLKGAIMLTPQQYELGYAAIRAAKRQGWLTPADQGAIMDALAQAWGVGADMIPREEVLKALVDPDTAEVDRAADTHDATLQDYGYRNIAMGTALREFLAARRAPLEPPKPKTLEERINLLLRDEAPLTEDERRRIVPKIAALVKKEHP